MIEFLGQLRMVNYIYLINYILDWYVNLRVKV